jgi:hypothetical protein
MGNDVKSVWELEREALGLAPSGPRYEETEAEIARWDAEYRLTVEEAKPAS